MKHAIDLRASWMTPERAPFRRDVFGAGRQPLSLRLANVSTHRVDIQHVTVRFTATRNGVPFLCAGGRDSTKVHEPQSLDPGESFVFERQIDCTMPLPGHYDIDMYVSLVPTAIADRGDFVGRFGMDVTADDGAPLAFPGRPGLYAMMTGGEATLPLPPESWARGDYHVVLGFVNATKDPLPLGPGELSFLTYRRGSSLACSGQSEPVALPEAIAPGTIHVVRAPVTCAPSDEGFYEIVGRFKFYGETDQVEVGRISLKVSRAPFLYVPEPRGDCGVDCQRQWLK